MTSHDPVGRHPVLPSSEDSDGGQQLLVSNVDILIHDRRVEEMAVETLDASGLLRTMLEIFVLLKGETISARAWFRGPPTHACIHVHA